MNIPKKFQLAGVTWKVNHTPTLANLGECHPQRGAIFLRGEVNQGKQAAEQAYCHELVHAILFTMGDSGPHDEKFVDGFGYLLHQYLNTAR